LAMSNSALRRHVDEESTRNAGLQNAAAEAGKSISRPADLALREMNIDPNPPGIWDTFVMTVVPSFLHTLQSSSSFHEKEEAGRDVYLHIYECNSATEWLNDCVLASKDMPIHHVGVEVFGEEFSFEHLGGDEKESGVIMSAPKKCGLYVYQKSIHVGKVKKSLCPQGVHAIIIDMSKEWLSDSYHLTKRNCVHFAESFLSRLKTGEPFPLHLKGVCDAVNNNATSNAIVDGGFSWLKGCVQTANDCAEHRGGRGSIDHEEGAADIVVQSFPMKSSPTVQAELYEEKARRREAQIAGLKAPALPPADASGPTPAAREEMQTLSQYTMDIPPTQLPAATQTSFDGTLVLGKRNSERELVMARLDIIEKEEKRNAEIASSTKMSV